MKKLILSIVALVATAMSANAQSEWKMVITHQDFRCEGYPVYPADAL